MSDAGFEERVAWHMKRLRGERVPARRTPELDAREQAYIRAYADAKAVQHRALQIIQDSRGANSEYLVDRFAPSRSEYFAKSLESLETRDASDNIEYKDCVNE